MLHHSIPRSGLSLCGRAAAEMESKGPHEDDLIVIHNNHFNEVLLILQRKPESKLYFKAEFVPSENICKHNIFKKYVFGRG